MPLSINHWNIDNKEKDAEYADNTNKSNKNKMPKPSSIRLLTFATMGNRKQSQGAPQL
jgi:hypothetical protein